MTSSNGHTPEGGPLAAATSNVVAWLKDASGGAVQIAPPKISDDGLSVWPLELQTERELRTHRALEPLRLRMRHLVRCGIVLHRITHRRMTVFRRSRL